MYVQIMFHQRCTVATAVCGMSDMFILFLCVLLTVILLLIVVVFFFACFRLTVAAETKGIPERDSDQQTNSRQIFYVKHKATT